MSIDNAAFIKEMNTSIPRNTDSRAEGAGQMQSIKTAVKNSFPNVDARVNADSNRMNEIFDNPSQMPFGIIVMWEKPDAIPTGFALCDGKEHNGVLCPDMRNMFVKGWGLESVGKNGGENVKNIPDYVYNEGTKLTIDQIPLHDHEVILGGNDAHFGPSTAGGRTQSTQISINKTKKTGGGLSHTHTLKNKENKIFDTQPEYIIMCYIKYVGKDKD